MNRFTLIAVIAVGIAALTEGLLTPGLRFSILAIAGIWFFPASLWLEIVESQAVFGVTPAVISTLERSEFLYVEFSDMTGSENYVALLATAADFVVIGRDSEEGIELDGLMTHDAFWDYLGSFPNIYKHLNVGNGRHDYWLKKDKNG